MFMIHTTKYTHSLGKYFKGTYHVENTLSGARVTKIQTHEAPALKDLSVH